MNFLPRYLQIKNALAEEIRSGAYGAHEQLPSIAEFMKTYAVSDGTVKRVLRELTAAGLVYTINGKGSFVSELARPAVREPERRVIAVVYGRRQNELLGSLFWAAVLRGVEEELSAHGLGLELINLRVLSLAELIEARRGGAFLGVLLTTMLEQQEMAELARYGSGTVSLFTEYEPVAGLYCLVNDELAGAKTATRHLLDCGCRQLGAILAPPKTSYAQQRWQGFLEALCEGGIVPDEGLIETGRWTVDSGYLAMQQLLERLPGLDGVFAANDMMAIGGIGAAFEAAREVPRDLRVIGYDDIEFAALFRPGLSTMRVDRAGMGRRAVRILLDRLEQPVADFQVERIPPTLVARASTKASG